MKKTILIVSLVLALVSAFVLIKNNKSQHENIYSEELIDKGYLVEVLGNLEQVKSATYNLKQEGYVPGDTSASSTYYSFVKEFDNPSDTTIGASFVKLMQEDTTRMSFCYDGAMRALVYRDLSYMKIDSFQITRTPFRPLNPPFFNYTKSIIKYALETEDSVTVGLKDLGDSVLFSLAVYGDKQVEFFGKPYYIDSPYGLDEEVSRYDIWINKSSGLPFRLKRDMSHDGNVTTCTNVELNKDDIKSFVASDYFPADVSLEKPQPVKSNLIGKTAPDWILRNVANKTVSLGQQKSKVLMVQFTSVSCGPCRLSVPFLNKLATEYSKEDFDFVSVESFNRNSSVLQKYQDRSHMEYDFLMSTDSVTKSYQIQSVPVFYILDKDRVIRKVIMGYGKGTTDKEIRTAINDLI